MAIKKYHIKKEGRLVTVKDRDGKTVYSSTRHTVVRADRHPYISGFSKLVDFGNSYSGLLKKVQKSPSRSIRSYWENVGTYTLDVMARNKR
jgi:hypothetical protein